MIKNNWPRIEKHIIYLQQQIGKQVLCIFQLIIQRTYQPNALCEMVTVAPFPEYKLDCLKLLLDIQ